MTAWYAIMLFLGFVAIGAVSWVSVSYAAEQAIDERLSGRMTSLISTVLSELSEGAEEEGQEFDFESETEEELFEYAASLPERRFHQIRHADGRPIFPAGSPELDGPPLEWVQPDSESSFRSLAYASTPYRILTQRLTFGGRAYDILLATSLDSVSHIRRLVVKALAVASPIALLLACCGGFFIARRALRPVNAINAAAASITVHDLQTRIPTTGSGDALDRLASTFNEMLSRLETSVARIEQFSADASHELRTPLTVIRTTAELALRHGRTPEDYRRDLQEIQDEAERLTSLISVMLTLAREDGGNSVPMAEFDLIPMVRSTCCHFEAAAREKGLTFSLDLSEPTLRVHGNEPAVRRLLSSLLDNALDHTREGSIGVSVVRNGAFVRLAVRDTGDGISKDALDHVFDRFFRADKSRGGDGHHAGLGLSIAKRIAELHGAEIVASSDEGRGSEFITFFPVRKPNQSRGSTNHGEGESCTG